MIDVGSRVVVASGPYAGEHGIVIPHPVTLRNGPQIMVALDTGPTISVREDQVNAE